MSLERRVVRIKEVLEITGLSKSVVYDMVSRNEFPRPVRISHRAVAWHQADIEEWLDSRPPATRENWM